jgi:hypothetical protein
MHGKKDINMNNTLSSPFNLSAMTLLIAVLASGNTSAQEHNNQQNKPSLTTASSYAGQQQREIKSLSANEQRGLLEGQGMGLAKAAELNGYPGPMHTLELARALQLTDEQKTKTQALMLRHKTAVKELGKQLVDLERQLDSAFYEKRITPDQLKQLTQRIGQAQAQIRAEHLATHLQQTALLTSNQIAQYSVLRGYTTE